MILLQRVWPFLVIIHLDWPLVLPSLPRPPRSQRRIIPLQRRMRLFQQRHCLERNAVDIDAAAAHLFQRGVDGGVAIDLVAVVA